MREGGWGIVYFCFLIFFQCHSVLAQPCDSLSFIQAVPRKDPTYSPWEHPCDRGNDIFKCDVRRVLGELQKTTIPTGPDAGREAFVLEKEEPRAAARQQEYLEPLLRSPAIREMNRFQIEARVVAGHSDGCEPIPVYLGPKKIFGYGPVFFDSLRFLLDGRQYGGFIALEDARTAGLALLSKESLIKGGYFDFVVAHEMAHSLLQDLYGIDAFEKLVAASVSRDGHSASAITDPAMAWMEGFAEGFEAYLGERYLAPMYLQVPRIAELGRKGNVAMDLFAAGGWLGYLPSGLPMLLGSVFSTLAHLDEFVTDYLISERQTAIRENHFVSQGAIAHLAHRYDLPPSFAPEAEIDAIAEWRQETTDGVYSKEGAVAHLVYAVLKQGLHSAMFRAIRASKPADVRAFVGALKRELSSSQAERLRPALVSLFTPEGRSLSSGRARELNRWRRGEVRLTEIRESGRRIAETLAEIPWNWELPLPKALWLEFRSASLYRKKFFGAMDRINLVTATPTRMAQFIQASLPGVYARDKALVNRIVLLIQRLREGGAAAGFESAAAFGEALRRESLNRVFEPKSAGFRRALSLLREKVIEASACYRSHCLAGD